MRIKSYLQLYQKPEMYKQSSGAAAAAAVAYNTQDYYVNGGIAPTTLRPSTALKQQIPIYLGNKNHVANTNHNQYLNNVTELHAIVLNARPQQTANNHYVASVVDLVIPQRKLHPTNDFYSINVSRIAVFGFY